MALVTSGQPLSKGSVDGEHAPARAHLTFSTSAARAGSRNAQGELRCSVKVAAITHRCGFSADKPGNTQGDPFPSFSWQKSPYYLVPQEVARIQEKRVCAA